MNDAIAGAVPIGPQARLAVTEGNYLLLDHGPFSKVRGLLDEAWFLAPDEAERVARLVKRHVSYGKTSQQAAEWVRRSDERDATLVNPTRTRADLVILGDPA